MPLPLDKATANLNNTDVLQDVFNKTFGFQKIFVINLPSRTDHRDSISSAAAFSDLQIEYVDGVTKVEEKTLPPGGKEVNLNNEPHLREVVLVASDLEEVGTHRSAPDQFLDPTYPQPSAGQAAENFILGGNNHITPATISPSGDLDRWGIIFWLGHCGVRFARASDLNAPLGRVVIADDPTMPEPQHIKMQFGNDELVREYPAHTRVVSRARMGTCTLAYGISQPGARRLLYELGLRKMTGTTDTTDTTDIMFRSVCDGVDGRPIRACLTVQPQLFRHHRAVGSKAAYSDITDHGDDYNGRAFTRNVRWSTCLNFPELVEGQTDYIDLFKVGEKSPVDEF